MSYCVNCGVELDNTAKKCALCNTPVINPNIKADISEESVKPFSDKLVIPEAVKKRFLAFVVSVTMFISNIVMFFLNVFFIRGNFWSIYVFSSCLLFWVVFVFPFFMKKIRPYVLWAFDTFAVSGFFFIIFALHGETPAVFKSVISVILLVSVSVLFLIIWLRRKKRHWTAVTFVLLLESTLVSLISGILVTTFSRNYNFFVVGMVIAICTFVLTGFFIYCNRSKHVRAWLNKAFYL